MGGRDSVCRRLLENDRVGGAWHGHPVGSCRPPSTQGSVRGPAWLVTILSPNRSGIPPTDGQQGAQDGCYRRRALGLPGRTAPTFRPLCEDALVFAAASSRESCRRGRALLFDSRNGWRTRGSPSAFDSQPGDDVRAHVVSHAVDSSFPLRAPCDRPASPRAPRHRLTKMAGVQGASGRSCSSRSF